MTSAAIAQCPRCRHYERRGGVLFPARMVCAALLNDDVRSAAAQRVIEAAAHDLASRGLCPNFAPVGDDMPDSYRAEDLPCKTR